MGGHLWFGGFDDGQRNALGQYRSPDGVPLEALGPLAPVNLFLGPNNSGKSPFLRALYMSSHWPWVSQLELLYDALGAADFVQRRPQSFSAGLEPQEAERLTKLRDGLLNAARGRAPDEPTRRLVQHVEETSPPQGARLDRLVGRPSKAD